MSKNLLIVPVLLFALLTSSVFAADLHFTGTSSVDGREIRYEDHTQFDNQRTWAINQWNALGKVSIQPDTWSTVSDLDWTDFEDCNPAAIDGYWQDGWSIDTIGLNACHYRDTLSAFDEQTVATHEQGHALGINDHPNGWQTLAIMYGCSACTAFNTPQQHDKDDYFALWP